MSIQKNACQEISSSVKRLASNFLHLRENLHEMKRVNNYRDTRILMKQSRAIKQELEPGLNDIQQTWREAKIEIVRRIIGPKNFYGPKDVELAFGTKPLEVPDIPFTPADLRWAKKVGARLILRVSQVEAGGRWTFKDLEAWLPRNKKGEPTHGEIIVEPDHEAVLAGQMSGFSQWVSVGSEPIPDSINKDPVEQLMALRDFVSQAPKYQDKDWQEYFSQPYMTEKLTEWAEYFPHLPYELWSRVKQHELNLNFRREPLSVVYDFILMAKRGLGVPETTVAEETYSDWQGSEVDTLSEAGQRACFAVRRNSRNNQPELLVGSNNLLTNQARVYFRTKGYSCASGVYWQIEG